MTDTKKTPTIVVKKAKTLKPDAMLGVLVSADDSVLIHTREAYKLFEGLTYAEGSKKSGVTGLLRMAAIFRELWQLTASDNFYVDFLLIQAMNKIDAIMVVMQRDTDGFLAAFEAKKPAMVINVLESSEPLALKLTFRSPYGYSVVELLLKYDYFVRIVRTAMQKTGVSGAVGGDLIYRYTHEIRSIVEELNSLYMMMRRDGVIKTNRMQVGGILNLIDRPVAEEEVLIVKKAVKKIGAVPLDVFLMKVKPRFTKLLPRAETDFSKWKDGAKGLTASDLALGVEGCKFLVV